MSLEHEKRHFPMENPESSSEWIQNLLARKLEGIPRLNPSQVDEVIEFIRKLLVEHPDIISHIPDYNGMPILERYKLLSELPAENPNSVIVIKVHEDGSYKVKYVNPQADMHFPNIEKSAALEGLGDIIKLLQEGDENCHVRTIEVKYGDSTRLYEQKIVFRKDENVLICYFNDVTDIAYMAEFPKHNPNPIIEINLYKPGEPYLNPEAKLRFKNSGYDFATRDIDSIVEELKAGKRRFYNRNIAVQEEDLLRIYEQKFVYNPKSNSIIIFFNDITQLKEAEREREKLIRELQKAQKDLQEQVIKDPLTNLYNRRYMEEALEAQLSRARRHQHPLGIIMLDVDHFQDFNDQFGHQAGDAVLKRLADILKQNTRQEDFVCRYGGEEFTLILPDTELRGSFAVAEKLRKKVYKHSRIAVNGKPLPRITISLGVISVIPGFNVTQYMLVKAADEALYIAKKKGRNRVCTGDISNLFSLPPTDDTLSPDEGSLPPLVEELPPSSSTAKFEDEDECFLTSDEVFPPVYFPVKDPKK